MINFKTTNSSLKGWGELERSKDNKTKQIGSYFVKQILWEKKKRCLKNRAKNL